MLSKVTNKVQIISEAGKYILPENFIKGIAHEYPDINMDYKIISIVGSQNSGKSTLLNAVFNTTFEVLADNDGIQQTTKGIWGAVLPSDKVLVMDVEGVDSKERWDEGADVGRFSGSNLKLLEIIFEINFRLFHDQQSEKPQSDAQRKGLLIILRDYSKKNNLEKIKQTVLNDIQKIWDEIIKPEKYREMTYDKFFNIQFETMANYEFEKPIFDDQCKELYKKLVNQNLPSSYFNYMRDYNQNEKVPVPFEALEVFIKNIWGIVRSCKDIDLPSQKIIVTDYRCRQINNELIKNEVNPKLELINAKLNQNIYGELKSKCEEMYNSAFAHFDAQTSFYDQNVVQIIRKELEAQLKDRTQKFLRRQIEMIKVFFSHQAKDQIKKLKELVGTNKFYANWSHFKTKTIESVEKGFTLSDIPFAEYDSKKSLDELRESIATSFDEFFKAELDNYTQTFFAKEMKPLLDEKIRFLFSDPSIIFWEEFNKYFFALWKKVIEKYETALIKGFDLSKKDADKQVAELKKQVADLVAEKILDRKPWFIQYIRGIFEHRFKMVDGKERIWTKCSEADIENYYKVALDFAERAADSFVNLEILDPNAKVCQEGGQDFYVVDAPEFPSLFSDSDCENYKNILREQAKSEMMTANLKANNANWYETIAKYAIKYMPAPSFIPK